MPLSDYLLNLVIIAAVVRQIRGKRLTVFGMLWPVGAVILAMVKYLRAVPTGGHDIILTSSCIALGAALGLACGVLTRISRRADGSLFAQATGAAAALWVAGIGARMGFALYAEHGGSAAIGRLSESWAITGARAWTAALLLMALAEVLGRTACLGYRSYRALAGRV